MPLVSLLLWHEMLAMHCFVWPLDLWVGGRAGQDSSFEDFNIWQSVSVSNMFLTVKTT